MASSRNDDIDNMGILSNEMIVMCMIDMLMHGIIHHLALCHVIVNSAEFVVSLKQQS